MLVTSTLAASIVAANGTTSAVPPTVLISYEFGFNAMIFFALVTAILANAFPLKTVFLTVNPLLRSGNAAAPDISPAFSLTLNLGAIAFPDVLCENTITSAAKASTACAMMFVYTCASRLLSDASATVCTFLIP